MSASTQLDGCGCAFWTCWPFLAPRTNPRGGCCDSSCQNTAPFVNTLLQCSHDLWFGNEQQSYTAECSSGTGEPVTVTVYANTVYSQTSRTDATAIAYQYAQDAANAQLECNG